MQQDYGVMHVVVVACPRPPSCCIYTALIPCFAAYTALIPCLAALYTALISLLFGTVIPTFNGNVFTPSARFTGFSLYTRLLFAFVRAPPHFAAHGHAKFSWVLTRK